MKQEEKIEVMLEAIFKSLEQISKKLEREPGGEELAGIKEDLEDFTNKLAQIPAPNRRELNILNEKLNTLIERSAYQKSPYTSSEERVKHHHYFWFFPDVKEWLMMVRSSSIGWVLGGVLLLSVGLNWYLGKDYYRFRESDLKYQFIKHAGNEDYIWDLDSAWQIDSIRNAWIDHAVKQEAIPQAEVHDKKKSLLLRRQLDSL